MLHSYLTLAVLLSNTVNYSEMQCWDTVSLMLSPGSPWGCFLNMTKFYWNREKMFKSEGKLAYPNAAYFFFFPAESVDLFFLQTFASWKIYDLTTISSHLYSLQDSHNSIWPLCCPYLVYYLCIVSLIYNFSLYIYTYIYISPSKKLIQGKTLRRGSKKDC